MSAGPPKVFVDDSDPNVVYSGQNSWLVQTGISTAPQPYILPARPPFYGTIHQVNGNGSFSYIYNGTDVTAIFNSADNGTFISSCIIDGKGVGCCSNEEPNLVLCSSGDGELRDGEHNITVIVTRNPNHLPITLRPYFDGLFYTPSNATYTSKAQELDLAYNYMQALSIGMNMTGHIPGALSAPGDGIDFDFNGTSMAIYVTYNHGNDVPVNLSYNVDGGPNINFTLDNPSGSTFSAGDQLILQTPQYAQGQHHLHLDFFGPASSDQALALSNFFVQNAPSTRKLALVPFPPTPNSSTTTSNAQSTLASPIDTSTMKSTSHHTAPRTIVAIVATLPAVLVIFILSVLYIKRRPLRGNFSSRDGPEFTVTPFIPAIFMRTIVYPSSKRMPDSVSDLARVAENVSKENRLVPPSQNPTQAAALPPVPTPLTPVRAPAAALPTAQDGTEDLIYRIHEDGGSVHGISSTAPTGQRQIIDLPPLYSSNFGRHPEPPEDSNAGSRESGA